ncbi:MAG: hypothetical protein ACRDZ7_06625 [Acidimicrobiia bacterium]
MAIPLTDSQPYDLMIDDNTRLFDPAAYEWLFVVCGDATAYVIPTAEIKAKYCLFLDRRYERFRLQD